MQIPDELFLEMMEELRTLLSQTEVERYNYFATHSQEGRECKYAQACLKLFQDKDQRQLLTNKLTSISQTLNL